jgi:hypothetical protein
MAPLAQPLALHLVPRQFVAVPLHLHLDPPNIQCPFHLSFSIKPINFVGQPCTSFVDLPHIGLLQHIGLLVAQTAAPSASILVADWQYID